MTGAAVMVVMAVVVAVITARLAVVVIATCVDRHSVIPVRGGARGRLPGEGRRQHRQEQDGSKELGDGSLGAAHGRRIVHNTPGFGAPK